MDFLTISINGSSPCSKPRKPILTAHRSLIFSSKSFLAAEKFQGENRKLHALEAKFLEKNNFLKNGSIYLPDMVRSILRGRAKMQKVTGQNLGKKFDAKH